MTKNVQIYRAKFGYQGEYLGTFQLPYEQKTIRVPMEPISGCTTRLCWKKVGLVMFSGMEFVVEQRPFVSAAVDRHPAADFAVYVWPEFEVNEFLNRHRICECCGKPIDSE